MKIYDTVKVTSDAYESEGVKKGDTGYIVLAEIRNNSFEVEFEFADDDILYQTIHVKDLEVVKEYPVTDNEILCNLPGENPNWWCKVENGFIMNLKGEKKNKIAYDYDS
ncbi:MAG: hypothetical protein IJU84_05315 [Clostridia bacterium]|nr:hypothetical protein [Clostridia bacterium]